MIKFYITAITFFIKSLVGAILSPIDSLLYDSLPELSNIIASVGQYFSWAVGFINWLLSWLPLSATTFNFIIAIWLFKLTVPVIVEAVKLVVKWWHALAP